MKNIDKSVKQDRLQKPYGAFLYLSLSPVRDMKKLAFLSFFSFFIYCIFA